MPSSTAYFARKGGASAVAVAASSDTTERNVRALYGRVSRASVAMRRRVRRHDQSSTSTFLIELRWLPGCQTLTGRRPSQVHARASPPGRGVLPPATRGRRYPTRSRASVPIWRRFGTSRRRFQRIGFGAGLDRIRELTLQQAV